MNSHRARLLVVDDDEKYGKLIARALAPAHEVLALTTAQEALDRIADGERFDLVLCDLMLPVVSGMDFYERVTSIAPEWVDRIVFITGGAYTERAEAFLAHAAIPRLEKPFFIKELRAVVEEHLLRLRAAHS